MAPRKKVETQEKGEQTVNSQLTALRNGMRDLYSTIEKMSGANKVMAETINEMAQEIGRLKERVAPLEARVRKEAASPQLHKVETFNGEEAPEPREDNMLRMTPEEKIQSMRNAIAILPPNYVDEAGRHKKVNVQALCGFIVTDEMLDEAYQGIESKQ